MTADELSECHKRPERKVTIFIVQFLSLLSAWLPSRPVSLFNSEANDRLTDCRNHRSRVKTLRLVFMKIITKMAIISKQTLSKRFQTLCKRFAKPMQTLYKPFANSFQTLYKLLSNALETPLKRFQTFDKLFANALKTLSKALQTPFSPN